jgi:hypothetical protein
MSDGKKPPIIGKKIKLSHAKKIIGAYRAGCDGTHIHSITMSADHLRKIIDQPDCHYVKFHVAVSDPTVKAQGLPLGHTIVAVGADSAQKSIIHSEEDTEVYDDGTTCPPTCNPDPDDELV